MFIHYNSEQYHLKEEDEIFFKGDEFIIVFHPFNNSLHFLDEETHLKIMSSIICKNRDHAKEIYKKYVS